MIFEILLPFLVYFVLHDGIQILLAALLNIYAGNVGTEKLLPYAGLINGMVSAISLLVPIAVLIILYKRQQNMPGQETHTSYMKYVYMLVFAASFALGLNYLFYLIGFTQSSRAYMDVASNQYNMALGMGILLYGFLSPLAEELVFRACMYNRLKKYFPVKAAIVIVSFLFGAYHVNLVQLVYGFLMGLAITYAYEKMQSLLAPIVFHMLANIVVYLVSYRGIEQGQPAMITGCIVFLCISAVAGFFFVRDKK